MRRKGGIRASTSMKPPGLRMPLDMYWRCCFYSFGRDGIQWYAFQLIGAMKEIEEVKQRLAKSTSQSEANKEQEHQVSDNEEPYSTEDTCILPKPIFVLSDCTGETAVNTVRAALGQFEQVAHAFIRLNMF